MTDPETPSRRAVLELVAVVVTGGTHLVFEEILHQKALFIGLAGLAWTLYIVRRGVRVPGELAAWGFSRSGERVTVIAVAVFVAIAVPALAGFGMLRGTFVLHWHMLPLLALYPVWGVLQQFVLQAILVRNLDLVFPRLPAVAITVLAALGFAGVHAPDLFLMGATFLLALAFTPMWLRWRSLWPLGVGHGVLGVLAYYWVLGRDPWIELAA